VLCCVADEIGVQIEEPFGILPLEDVCVDIQVGRL
jgi:predicted membrane chloride channel (bestrophin family)